MISVTADIWGLVEDQLSSWKRKRFGDHSEVKSAIIYLINYELFYNDVLFFMKINNKKKNFFPIYLRHFSSEWTEIRHDASLDGIDRA